MNELTECQRIAELRINLPKPISKLINGFINIMTVNGFLRRP